MPRPESPEGPWVTVPVRVRKSLLRQIDGVLGDRNRSEWFRSLAESAVAGDPRVSAGPPLEDPPAGVITGLSDAEVDGFVAAASEGREPAPAKPRRRAAAPRTVSPAAPGVPPTAFQEPAEDAPDRPSSLPAYDEVHGRG